MASKHGGARPGAGRKAGEPNKANRALKEFAQQYTEQAVLALAEIMTNDSEGAAARVSAANALLDRAHGKPAQSVSVDGEMSFKGLEVIVRRNTSD